MATLSECAWDLGVLAPVCHLPRHHMKAGVGGDMLAAYV